MIEVTATVWTRCMMSATMTAWGEVVLQCPAAGVTVLLTAGAVEEMALRVSSRTDGEVADIAGNPVLVRCLRGAVELVFGHAKVRVDKEGVPGLVDMLMKASAPRRVRGERRGHRG